MSGLTNEENKLFHSYTLLTHCGGGAYGDVWYCQDISGKKLALKIISKKRLGDQWERELKGVRNYRQITEKQPGLLQIYHVGEDDESFFYTMEPADNAGTSEYKPDTLAYRLQNGALSPEEYPAILDGIFHAIKAIHDEGFTHRDIKPDNILFVNGQPKLADIGLMSSLMTDVTQLAGTLDFLPPEQRVGEVQHDRRSRQRSDLYAFGKVIYCTITGQQPQKYPSPPEKLTYAPAEKYFFRLAIRLCDHDIYRRIVTVGALSAEMAEIRRKLEYGETFRDKVRSLVNSFYLYLRTCTVHTWQWGKRHYFLVSGAALFAALTGYYLSGNKVVKEKEKEKEKPESPVTVEQPVEAITSGEEQNRLYSFFNNRYSVTIPSDWQIIERPALIKEIKKRPEKEQYTLLKGMRHTQAYFLLPKADETAAAGARIMVAVLPFRDSYIHNSTDDELIDRTGRDLGCDLTGLRVSRYDNFRNQGSVTMMMGRLKNGERVDLFLLPRKDHAVCLLLNQGPQPVSGTMVKFVVMLESLRQSYATAVYTPDPDGRNEFMQAVLSHDFTQAEAYLNKGADINAAAYGNNTALHFAVQDDLPDVVKFLLEQGADVNVQDHLKMTPLHIAARDGNTAILKELLEQKTNLELRDFSELPALYYAVSGGHGDCVKLLLKAGADVKIITHPIFKTPLIMTAVVQNDPEVLKALIAGKIDLQAKNGLGENALLRVLNLYVSGRDPLKSKLAEILIEAGIDVNCRDEKGVTALMYAAVIGDEALIKLLLKHGADKMLKDGQGRSASAYLDRSKYPGLAKYF